MFKKAVITRHSWQLKKKKAFSLEMLFRDLLRKKKLLKQSVEDLFTTWRLPLEAGNFHWAPKWEVGMPVLFMITTRYRLWTVQSPGTALQPSKLCTDVSNKGCWKPQRAPTWYQLFLSWHPARSQSHPHPSGQHVHLRDWGIADTSSPPATRLCHLLR